MYGRSCRIGTELRYSKTGEHFKWLKNQYKKGIQAVLPHKIIGNHCIMFGESLRYLWWGLDTLEDIRERMLEFRFRHLFTRTEQRVEQLARTTPSSVLSIKKISLNSIVDTGGNERHIRIARRLLLQCSLYMGIKVTKQRLISHRGVNRDQPDAYRFTGGQPSCSQQGDKNEEEYRSASSSHVLDLRVPFEIRFDELIDISIHYSLNISNLFVCPVILHHS